MLHRLSCLLRLPSVAALSLLCLALPAVARAQVSGDDLGFSLIGQAQWGKAKPVLIFQPSVALSGVRADCQRSDGQKVAIGIGSVRAGSEKRVAIPQGKGVFDYKCTLAGKAGKQAFAGFQLDFRVAVGEPPRIDIKAADFDEAKRTLTLRMSEPAAKIELDVVGDNGKLIANVVQQFQGEAAGTPLVVSWQQAQGEVMGRFQLRAYEPAGFFSGVESVTFVDIPHEDVVFESGKWDIRPSEEGKLLAPLGEILASLQKVQGVLAIELYIGGYTDTVGQPADNIELSRKRAAAIAAWFLKKGVTVPISFQGFGEGVLAVATPDHTPEPRNRRASYVLATQPPPANRGFPTRHWSRAR